MPRLLIVLCLSLTAACRAVPPLPFTATQSGAPTRTATPLPWTASPSPTVTPSAPPSATGTRPPTATPFFGQVAIPYATVRYYTVTGATAGELRAALDANGLVDEAGARGDALTKWYVSWHWRGWGKRDCDLLSVKLAYIVQVFMPRWDPPAAASPALRERWAAYTAALAAHERGHVDNIVRNYRAVEPAIREARCLTAEAAAQGVIAVFRAFDVAYDAATRHGATQGAIFP